MAEIRSRVTLEQIIRKGIFVGMVVVFGAYFAYDGYIGYPRKNLDQIRKGQPDMVPLEHPPINGRVTVRNTERIVADQLTSLEKVREVLGDPDHQSDDGLSFYWFGPAVAMKVTTIGEDVIPRGNIRRATAAYKTELDIRTQKILALVLAIVGIPLIVHYLRVLTYSAQLNDQGLKVSGRPLIPFEAMTGLDAARYREKGWMELQYRRDAQDATVRLDDYWIRDFTVLINALCERKGFENPLDSKDSEIDSAPPAQNDEP
jgi:hypothetical protein